VVVRRRESRRIGEQDAHGSVRYAVAMLVRTWNLFHGNASPPERRAYLREMVDLVTRDDPDVVCLQELPVWALRHLERWSGMHATVAVARKPLLPFGARLVTDLHHGLLRSAVTGEADAILTRKPARDLGPRVMGQTKLRRIAHAVSVDSVKVVNFHIDGRRDQFDRVLALASERTVVAGDANFVAPAAEGFTPPLAGSIDQILVRGLELVDGPTAWPQGRRVVGGRVLSDHAPVEAVVE
jgi:endonuclease/exonuclease/phosphatase family metal-dependent hydrolase